jgi:hypothetical protein
VLGTGAGLPSRLDHAAVGDEAAHTRNILVVHVLHSVGAEAAHLASRERAATTATAEAPTRAIALISPVVTTLTGLPFIYHMYLSFQQSSAISGFRS